MVKLFAKSAVVIVVLAPKVMVPAIVLSPAKLRIAPAKLRPEPETVSGSAAKAIPDTPPSKINIAPEAMEVPELVDPNALALEITMAPSLIVVVPL